ncbi:hypothetical protein [Sciscionella sediminilitoris]|nr:hypothetical protein [Sciscionella sp. SE31]
MNITARIRARKDRNRTNKSRKAGIDRTRMRHELATIAHAQHARMR